MGGIHQGAVIEYSLPQLRAEIADAMEQTGGHKFILAPGCTIGSHCPDHLLNAVATMGREFPLAEAAQ